MNRLERALHHSEIRKIHVFEHYDAIVDKYCSDYAIYWVTTMKKIIKQHPLLGSRFKQVYTTVTV